jgi:hypothetical protein
VLLRFCAHRSRSERGKCSCIYVIWVRRSGYLTYISFGVDPKYLIFWFCGYGDHFAKMNFCRSKLINAIDDSY